MIKVILLERIERLGKMGDTVSVRPGYARNFLLPQKKALRATKANMELFEKQRADLEAKNETLRIKAQEVASQMKGLSVIIIRQASEMGMLFGSVTSRDVAVEIRKTVEAVDRTMVQINTPIKTLGLFAVKVKLHPEVVVDVTVNVARSEAEANVQVEKEAKATKDAEKAAKAEAERAIFDAIGTEAPMAEDAKEEKTSAE